MVSYMNDIYKFVPIIYVLKDISVHKHVHYL